MRLRAPTEKSVSFLFVSSLRGPRAYSSSETMVGSEMAQRLSALPYSLPARQQGRKRTKRK